MGFTTPVTLGAGANNAGSSSLTVSASVAAGDIIAVSTLDDTAQIILGSVTDSGGNTYTAVSQGAMFGFSGCCGIWYALCVTPLTSGVSTITFTRAGVVGSCLSALKASGGDRGTPFDAATANAAQGNALTMTVTSGTPSRENQLFVACNGLRAGTGTQPGDWTS